MLARTEANPTMYGWNVSANAGWRAMNSCHHVQLAPAAASDPDMLDPRSFSMAFRRVPAGRTATSAVTIQMPTRIAGARHTRRRPSATIVRGARWIVSVTCLTPALPM